MGRGQAIVKTTKKARTSCEERADRIANLESPTERSVSPNARQQPERRDFIALGLDEDLENLAFAVDSTPHIHLPSGD
jgi:hypothetical protein